MRANSAHRYGSTFAMSTETNLKNSLIMNQAVVISTRVLATINSLPDEERSAMAAALTGEFILGMDVSKELTEMQQIVYRIIRNYVVSDMRRAAN